MNINQLVTCNQSIKIVPSLEESLQCMGLNVQLDENTSTWFDQLNVTWKTWKKSPTVEHHVKLFFQTSPDPYRIALVFVIKCKDFKDCKPKTLPFFIMETLQKWSCDCGAVPENFLKLPAFRVATEQRSQHFLSLVIKIYQINTIKETIVPIVKDMIKNDNCKLASQVIIAMELFEDISVEDLMFPLILQDKPNMIDEYLSECPSQVGPLLLFLDKLLDKNFSIREYAQNYIDENKISHVKYEKIHHKPLGKLVARLCNKFNIPIETCKNLSKNRTVGGLKYLIYQKYVDHNVSSAVWDDLVKDALKQNAESAKEFIDMLLDYDRKEALKWVEYLNLPETSLPVSFKEMSLQEVVSEDSENWDVEEKLPEKYYNLTLPAENIVIIDTAEKFYDLMTTHLAGCNVVSIDCEWKPSFGATQSQVALIQIATDSYVYLIDTLIFNKKQYSSFWYSFNKSLLDNAEIIKLGFGLEQDLKEIKASIVGLNNIKVKGEGLLDISILWKNLINCGLSLQSNSNNGGNSLSSLVQTCFGLPLEKSEQCSNWELRPLRTTQIQYAALDAHVLLELYNYLRNQCIEQGINFDEISNDIMLDTKTKCIKKSKVVERFQTSTLNLEKRRVYDVKFFVESKLTNLIPYLRHCGFDTISIPTTMLWHDVINSAISEDRYILLSKLKYTPSKNYPQSSILELGKGKNIQEQLLKIITYFNIKISKNDFLPRCIKCNKVDFKKLTPQDVVELCGRFQSFGNSNSNTNRYFSNDDDEEANYDNFLSDSEDIDEDILYGPVLNPHPNNVCVTTKGVPIEILNIHELINSPQVAILCESCGKLFWDGDDLFKSVNNVMLSLFSL
ncbi:unnamed protein product [Parnassius mnemosyne]|uniref:3'-5' exonuclease domain-containing protein n=1 Tax=Parnassius mnemosyne TaxID=213953 RepID=A0AAV1M7F0_9NEOP